MIELNDRIATEIFPTMGDLIIRLKSAPITSGFDIEKDRKFLEMVEERCKTSRGIETPVHRITVIAKGWPSFQMIKINSQGITFHLQ